MRLIDRPGTEMPEGEVAQRIDILKPDLEQLRSRARKDFDAADSWDLGDRIRILEKDRQALKGLSRRYHDEILLLVVGMVEQSYPNLKVARLSRAEEGFAPWYRLDFSQEGPSWTIFLTQNIRRAEVEALKEQDSPCCVNYKTDDSDETYPRNAENFFIVREHGKGVRNVRLLKERVDKALRNVRASAQQSRPAGKEASDPVRSGTAQLQAIDTEGASPTR